MMKILKKIVLIFYEKVFDRLFVLPLQISFFFNREIGRDYKFGYIQKLSLILKFRRTLKKVETLSEWIEHLEMAAEILKIPPSVKGDVIECGCYKGGSTINLSIVCSIVNRKLIVCDSFQGLPEPGEDEKVHYSVHKDHYDHYERGKFFASLEEVKNNIKQYGELDVCEFVVGFFEDTMKNLNREIVMGFLDIDLIQSLKPCLQGIWQNLQNECKIYVHEAKDLELVSLFFDQVWWQKTFRTAAPGFVGAGTGLPLRIRKGSELGYAVKKTGK